MDENNGERLPHLRIVPSSPELKQEHSQQLETDSEIVELVGTAIVQAMPDLESIDIEAILQNSRIYSIDSFKIQRRINKLNNEINNFNLRFIGILPYSSLPDADCLNATPDKQQERLDKIMHEAGNDNPVLLFFPDVSEKEPRLRAVLIKDFTKYAGAYTEFTIFDPRSAGIASGEESKTALELLEMLQPLPDEGLPVFAYAIVISEMPPAS